MPERAPIVENVISPGPTARSTDPTAEPSRPEPGVAASVLDGRRPRGESVLVYVVTLIRTVALIGAGTLAWGWGLSWLDVGLAIVFCFVSGLGVTVGSTATSPTVPSRPAAACASGWRSPAASRRRTT